MVTPEATKWKEKLGVNIKFYDVQLWPFIMEWVQSVLGHITQEKILCLSLYALYKKHEQVNYIILTDYIWDFVPIFLYVSPIAYYESFEKYSKMWIISDF